MPTQRQKKAFDRVVENGGVVSTAMIDAGYSKETAKTPQKLTESEGWKELMALHLPDGLIAEKHRELLEKREVVVVRDGKNSHVELTDQPHSDVKSALDMAYKLKGSYAAEKSQSVIVNLSGEIQISKKEKDLKEEYEAKLKASMLE